MPISGKEQVHGMAHMEKSENKFFVESVPSFHLHMVSRDQNQVIRLSWDTSTPAQSSHQLKSHLLATGSCSLQAGCY